MFNDRCRSSAVAVLFRSLTPPVFAQWLIHMVLTIEISQLQFHKVVFVPVVQIVQFILSSTSLPWRKGWFPWSCMSKTIEIPPVAVHVVVDVHVVLWLQVPQVRMAPTVQYAVEAPQLAPESLPLQLS